VTEYTPNKWVVVDFGSHYRVFGTWSGGYLDGDSWRLNSGIAKVTESGDTLEFRGSSGSVYRCRRGSYGIAGAYNSGVLGDRKILPEDTDWLNFDWKVAK
jgi:hypothetical protein